MRLAVPALLGLASCLDTGAEPVRIPLSVAGSASASFSGREGWEVELARAELAFGPLRLCAGERATGTCDTARAEWLDSGVVDVLSEEPNRVGELSGFGGVVRSATYDFGVVSLLTREDNLALDAVEALDGYSLRLEGTAQGLEGAFNFSAALRIEQNTEVDRGSPLVRVELEPAEEHDLSRQGSALIVRFDARNWLANVDFAASMNAHCQPACPDPLLFEEGSQAARAIRTDVQAGARPSFEWSVGEP